MKVKALDREFEVNEITFAQRRKLHKKNAGLLWDSISSGEKKIDPDKYYEMLDTALELSGLKEKDFDGFSDAEIDQILQAIAVEYLGLTEAGKD